MIYIPDLLFTCLSVSEPNSARFESFQSYFFCFVRAEKKREKNNIRSVTCNFKVRTSGSQKEYFTYVFLILT